jgi:hypothetical protein
LFEAAQSGGLIRNQPTSLKQAVDLCPHQTRVENEKQRNRCRY